LNVVTFSYLPEISFMTYCALSIRTTWFLTGLNSVFSSCCLLSIYRYYLVWIYMRYSPGEIDLDLIYQGALVGNSAVKCGYLCRYLLESVVSHTLYLRRRPTSFPARIE
jgi:hypothetical protein